MTSRRWIVMAALMAANSVAAFAQTEIGVIAPRGILVALEQLIPVFEGKTGYKVKITYGTGPGSRQMVARGDAVDVPIVQTPLDEVLKSGHVVESSAKQLASIELGVAVKKGAPKPDMSSPEAVKKSLRAAKSIVYPDAKTAAAGVNFDLALKNMGLTQELEPKLKRTENAAAAMKATENGEAELGITFLSEMTAGVENAGALPREFSTPPSLYGYISAHTKDRKAAQALLDFLAGPEAMQVYGRVRMTPAAR
jgi:molybdate transport system substrate-binding protein